MPLALTIHNTPAQVGTVGKAENAYLAGVRVPDVTAGGVAERAGIRAGDVLLRVGDYEVRAAPDQVRSFESRGANEVAAAGRLRGRRQLLRLGTVKCGRHLIRCVRNTL